MSSVTLNKAVLKHRSGRMILHLLLLIGVVIWVYPFVWMISASLKTSSEYFTQTLRLIPEAPQWGNYSRAWVVGNFGRYFFNSVIVSTGTTIITIVLSCLTGYALGRYSFPGRKVVLTLVAAAVFFPTGSTMIPVYRLVDWMGLISTLLGVIVAQAGGTPTLFILLFTVHFSKLPDELEDSAEMDGAGYVQTFFHIFLPLSMPVVASAAILRFLWSWNDFLIPLIYTLQNPELRTVAVGMFSFVGEHTTDFTGMIAAASIALLPLILIFVFFQRFFIDATAGAVKG